MPLPARGCRVLAPFGSRRVIGVVTAPAAAAGGRELKSLLDVVDEVPLIAPPLLDLGAWVASHYLAPPGECYRLALPPAGVRASRAVVRLTAPVDAGGDPLLAALGDGRVRVASLARKLGRDPSARLRRLAQEGTVRIEQHRR